MNVLCIPAAAPRRLGAAGYSRITRPEGGAASPHLLRCVCYRLTVILPFMWECISQW